MKRYLLFSLGIVATGLAALGVWVPGLPTTVFLIIALWAFANSSQKLHHWLVKAPLFRHGMVHAKHFEQHHAVTTKVKIIALSFAWGSFLLTLLLRGAHNVATIIVFFAALSCSIAMYAMPTYKGK